MDLCKLEGKRVFVAGHAGMVGAALVRRLVREGCDILTVPRSSLDLRRQAETEAWFAKARPHAVFLAAARVGGIVANRDHPGEFIYDNLAIGANVMHAAHRTGVDKLLFLGSSCIYPRLTAQPIAESALLSGPLEPTNAPYAVAKIAGITMAQAYRAQYGCDFICAQPTNLYGPGDNFDLESSHVLPALIRKAHEARLAGETSMVIWGSGTPLREFMHVDDLADALVFIMRHYSDPTPINVGTGEELSIADLARLVCEIVGFEGELSFDRDMPDGTPRKLLDVGRLAGLGWRHAIDLRSGIAAAYGWYLADCDRARGYAAE